MKTTTKNCTLLIIVICLSIVSELGAKKLSTRKSTLHTTEEPQRPNPHSIGGFLKARDNRSDHVSDVAK